MYEEYMMEHAEYVIVSYGSSARICRDTIKMLRAKGILGDVPSHYHSALSRKNRLPDSKTGESRGS